MCYVLLAINFSWCTFALTTSIVDYALMLFWIKSFSLSEQRNLAMQLQCQTTCWVFPFTLFLFNLIELPPYYLYPYANHDGWFSIIAIKNARCWSLRLNSCYSSVIRISSGLIFLQRELCVCAIEKNRFESIPMQFNPFQSNRNIRWTNKSCYNDRHW